MAVAETNGIETYYERRGDGPPVVFVHASIMDHSMWEPQLAALRDDYETVAYDLRGHGRTGGSDRERYTVDLYVDDLDALITSLDLEKPVLCGLSWGGCVAQAYAARYPDRIAGLALADTFTPDASSLGGRLTMFSLQASILPVRIFGYPRVQAVMTRLQELFNRGTSGQYDEIERLQAEAPTIETAEFGKIIRSILAFRDASVDYAAIVVPTLVLYGENVPGYLRGQAERLGIEIPGATVRAVPGGGHASNVDNPEFFTSALRDLLDRSFPENGPDRAAENQVGRGS